MSRASRPSPGPSGRVALARDLVATARALNTSGLNRGTSGNVSVRWGTGRRGTGRRGDGFLVTPSGFPYDRMKVSDVVEMTLEGAARGRHAPSSEWPFHAAIYAARPDVSAIVHVHSEAAMALSCLRRGLPSFHYMVAVAGGRDIRCAPYATFGTPALASHAVAALEGRRACLLANHGSIAVGATLGAALALAVEVEALCATYLRALAVGEPVRLTDAEMDEALAKFSTYGAAAPRSSRASRGSVGGR